MIPGNWQSKLFHRATGCRMTHVCLGDGEVVLSPGVFVDVWYPQRRFLLEYPEIDGWFVVEPRPIRGHRERKRPLSTLARLAWPGLYGTDCVATVCRLMGWPATISTPRLLHSWLSRRYAYTRLLDYG